MFSLGGQPVCLVRSCVRLLLNPLLVGKVRNCLWKTLDDVVSDACPGFRTKGSKTRPENETFLPRDKTKAILCPLSPCFSVLLAGIGMIQ